MKSKPPQIRNSFNDWISVSQHHKKKVKFVGLPTYIDQAGKKTLHKVESSSIDDKYGRAIRVKTDGNVVMVSGNVAAFGERDNAYNIDLDATKEKANLILKDIGLPAFNDGEILKNQKVWEQEISGKKPREYNVDVIDTGAKISRLDQTAMIETGSAEAAKEFLENLKRQNIRGFHRAEWPESVIFSTKSNSRRTIFYLKGAELRKHAARLHKEGEAEQSRYVEALADTIEKSGVIRCEISYRRYLKKSAKKMYMWRNATQENVNHQFNEDFKIMAENAIQNEVNDFSEIPKEHRHIIKTLGLYRMGEDPREYLSRKTYYVHKKLLKQYGYDISAKNLAPLPTRYRIVTIKESEKPNLYEVNKSG